MCILYDANYCLLSLTNTVNNNFCIDSYCFFLLGLHNRWNRTVGIRHPNLWIFIRKMKDEERQSRFLIRAADRGDQPPTRKRKFRNLETRIRLLKQDYAVGNKMLP